MDVQSGSGRSHQPGTAALLDACRKRFFSSKDCRDAQQTLEETSPCSIAHMDDAPVLMHRQAPEAK